MATGNDQASSVFGTTVKARRRTGWPRCGACSARRRWPSWERGGDLETDEESYANLVRRSLDAPPPEESTVDIGRVMTEERRRRRIRRLTGVLAAGTAAAVIVVGVPVGAAALRHEGPPAVAASPNASAVVWLCH